MAEGNEDKSSKTEDPTERKLRKLREEGNVPRSREVNNFFMLLAVLLALMVVMPTHMYNLMNIVGGSFADAGNLRVHTPESAGEYMTSLSNKALLAIAPFFLVMLAFAVFGGVIQTGLLWSIKAIEPKLGRISLIKGLERMFSVKSLMEFLKSVLKLIIVGAVIGFIMVMYRDEFLLMAQRSLLDITRGILFLIILFFAGALAIALILAVIDFIFQRSEFIKDNRMSRREVKDEMKESEGDPFIKNRQRQIRQQRARSRMMQEVPKSDVVITNPTHFSVALAYDGDKDAAPRVVAKGVDHLAMKIREVAKEFDIPLYEDAPLARQLYYNVELEQEVPLNLYEAVAKIIAYIYNIKNKKVA